MEKKLHNALDTLHMDEDCVRRIEAAMEEQGRRHTSFRLRHVIAVCMVLILVGGALNPTTARALEELAMKIRNYFNRSPGTIILEEDYAYYNDGQLEIDSQLGQTTVHSNTQFSPTWLKVMDDRVYYTGGAGTKAFLADREQFDITGRFSAEEPFLATFEQDGITHYIAIGGDFDPETGLDSIGCCEWLRRTDKMEEGIHAGWLGGASRVEYLDEEGTIFALWMARAIVKFGVPWNQTEAQEILKDFSS